ncbi:MAG: TrmH family RNA methyltransferase [Betaproteobacteria bacterium]|jgi:TrmH family RNA methyltransferase
MARVSSPRNARLREVARLIASSRDRRKSGRCVLEGAHLIDVFVARFGPPETLVVLEDATARPDVADLVARVPPSRTLVVSHDVFDELATLPADVAVVAVVATPGLPPPAPADFCLLLEDVQDPGNVGSIIRTAAAAGVSQVWLSSGCAFAWAPKVLRAAQGAHFLTTLVENVALGDWVLAYRRGGGRTVATVVGDATPLHEADLRGRVAVAIGSEGLGLSPATLALVDERITIPMASGSESLNAAAAAAVVLFEGVRQRTRGQRPGTSGQGALG